MNYNKYLILKTFFRVFGTLSYICTVIKTHTRIFNINTHENDEFNKH